MAKIDCSNIFNFVSEWERRRKDNSDAGFRDTTEIPLGAITKARVADLQKWSDSHPRMTHKEKFEKMCEENGFKNVLESLKPIDDECLNCAVCLEGDCNKIIEYWNGYVD